MTLGSLAVRNIWRNRIRTVLTVCAIAAAVTCFLLLRTVIWAWTVGVEEGETDRIATRHKVTFVMTLPERYAHEVRKLDGVRHTTHATWFGGKDPRYPNEFFATLAVDPDTFFDVYTDMVAPPEQLEAWKKERSGVIVGDVLAKKMGYSVGDRVTLEGSIYSGEWDFTISGVYEAKSRVIDRSQFLFHWDYLNESIPEVRRDAIGWIISTVEPQKGASVSKAVDAIFDERDTQTLTMSEKAMNLSFLGMFSAVLDAIDIVSGLILGIMMLIVGNTIAMGVRERTYEYGVLRAIGFQRKHIAGFVLGEAMVVALVGAGVGLLVGYPLINEGLGRFLEENMGAYFPHFEVPVVAAMAAVGLTVLLSLLAALLPAMRASKLEVTDALRRVA